MSMEWQPIETLPLTQHALLWARGWRAPFVGMLNGGVFPGACWIDDACGGFQMYGATHWIPLPPPPESK